MLKATLAGGGNGTAIATVLTLVFNLVPILILTAGFLGHRSLNDQQQSVLVQAALTHLVKFAVTAAVGFAVGASLMAATSLLLNARPALVNAAGIGALIGAIGPPVIVLLAMTLPATLDGALNDPALPATLMWHWLLSLGLAASGAVTGLVAFVAFAALARNSRTGPRK